MQWARLALAGAAVAGLSSAVLAQSNTIRFIVGTAPGGAIDPYARIIADPMAKALNQSIIVEYKPGANGNASAQFIADQPADGQYVWIGTQAFTEINPSVFTNQRWSIDDFVPFIRGVEAPLVFAVHPDVPAKTFAEFLAWAKQNKGKLSYSSYQPGTPSHFLGYQLNEKFDLDLTHVPYRGSGLQATALLAGHAQFGFAQLNSTAPHYATGKLRILAMTGKTRDKLIPDVPTFEPLERSGTGRASFDLPAGATYGQVRYTYDGSDTLRIDLLDGSGLAGESVAFATSRVRDGSSYFGLSEGGERLLETQNIVIASGSEPTPLPGVAFEDGKVIDSTGALSLPAVPKKLIVVGAGIIGLELGSVWRRLGAEVTVVEFLDRVTPGMDTEVATTFQRTLTKQGMSFKLGAKVTGAKSGKDGVELTVEPSAGGAAETIKGDVVLVAIGRRPYTDGLGLESVGVTPDKRGFIDKDRIDLTERQSVEYWMKRWGVTKDQITAAHRKVGRMTKDIAAELGKKR